MAEAPQLFTSLLFPLPLPPPLTSHTRLGSCSQLPCRTRSRLSLVSWVSEPLCCPRSRVVNAAVVCPAAAEMSPQWHFIPRPLPSSPEIWCRSSGIDTASVSLPPNFWTCASGLVLTGLALCIGVRPQLFPPYAPGLSSWTDLVPFIWPAGLKEGIVSIEEYFPTAVFICHS